MPGLIDGKRQTVAPEFVTSSISSGRLNLLSQPIIDNLENNPSTYFYEPDNRGYCLHGVNNERWTARMRGVDTVLSENSVVKDVATFEVRAGSVVTQAV